MPRVKKRLKALGTRRKAQSTGHKAQGTKHRAQGERLKVKGKIRYLILGAGSLVLVKKLKPRI